MKNTNNIYNLFDLFPLAKEYSRFLEEFNITAREKHTLYNHTPYSERHLQCLWFDPSLRPKTLHTESGELVTVNDPGRWNLEAGPDFLNASLNIGPEHRIINGDIEIHIRPKDWIHHKHSKNPAYSNVIAHVCYYPGTIPETILPYGCLQIPLARDLTANKSFSFENIDITAFPYASITAKQTPCAKIINNWSLEDKQALLKAAGHERLRRKTEQIMINLQAKESSQVLFEEIMTALGYKHNRIPFRTLATSITLNTINKLAGSDPVRIYALLLGTSGLMPTKPTVKDNDKTSIFIRSLWDQWWKMQSSLESKKMNPASWHLHATRPQNHPIRRLAAAASLFSQTTTPLKKQLTTLDTSAPALWMKQASDIFTQTPGIPFLKDRLTFAGKKQTTPINFIGKQRASAMITNVIIPFLAAYGIDITTLLDKIPPEQNNAIMREASSILFGRDHNPTIYKEGICQQGLIQIFHDFCLNRRGACDNCKLIASLKNEKS